MVNNWASRKILSYTITNIFDKITYGLQCSKFEKMCKVFKLYIHIIFNEMSKNDNFSILFIFKKPIMILLSYLKINIDVDES